MSTHRHIDTLLPAGLCVVACLTAAPAVADPSSGWTNHRVLLCDGTTVDTYLTPRGFGSPFHVVDSTDIIKPKHVEVIFPGTTEAVTTFDVPGFDRNGRDTVHCSYVDPADRQVSFDGLRT